MWETDVSGGCHEKPKGPALMTLLGHVKPEMTMKYVLVAGDDLQREFHLARSKPRHLAPQPKAPTVSPRAGLEGVVDSLLFAEHAIDVPSLAAGRPAPTSSRSTLQSAHQDPLRSPQTQRRGITGRDWPEKGVLRPSELAHGFRWFTPLSQPSRGSGLPHVKPFIQVAETWPIDMPRVN